MTSTSITRIAAAPAWPDFLRRLVRTSADSIVATHRALQRSRERRAAHRTLLQLDERTLRDLGLHRSELGLPAKGREVANWLDTW